MLHQSENFENYENFDSNDFGTYASKEISNFVEDPFKKYKNPPKYHNLPDYSPSKSKFYQSKPNQEFPISKHVKKFKPIKPVKYFENFHPKKYFEPKHYPSRQKYFKSKKYFKPKQKYLSETGRNHFGNGKRYFQSKLQNIAEQQMKPLNSLKMKPIRRNPLQRPAMNNNQRFF